jgi:hypothetical protein
MPNIKLTDSPKPTDTHSDWTPWVKLLIVLFGVFVLGTLLAYRWRLGNQGDINVYYGYAQAIWGGALPYRNFALEYPPGALVFIILAWPLGMAAGSYAAGYVTLSMLAAIIVLRHIYRYYSARGVLATAVIMIPLVPLFFYCLDIFAAAALYGALVILRKSWRWAAVLLAAAVLIKGYPIVCLPFFIIALPKARIWGFLRYVGATLTLTIAPFLLASPAGVGAGTCRLCRRVARTTRA